MYNYNISQKKFCTKCTTLSIIISALLYIYDKSYDNLWSSADFRPNLGP